MSNQLDLFGLGTQAPADAPQPRPTGPAVLPVLIPTPPSLEWAKLLTRIMTTHATWIHVSRLWTRVVAETLCDGPDGRWGWHNERGLITFPVDPGCRARIVYLDPAAAEALHRRHPLIRIGTSGGSAARFRFSEPGEIAPSDLDLPLTVSLTFDGSKS